MFPEICAKTDMLQVFSTGTGLSHFIVLIFFLFLERKISTVCHPPASLYCGIFFFYCFPCISSTHTPIAEVSMDLSTRVKFRIIQQHIFLFPRSRTVTSGALQSKDQQLLCHCGKMKEASYFILIEKLVQLKQLN